MTTPMPSFDHGTGDTALLYRTIGGFMDDMVAQVPDNDALVSVQQQRRFTYREFGEVTDALARGLLDLGVAPGDRVGIWGVNVWEWVAVQFATAKMGAVLVNINPAYRTHELEYALRQSETETLILMEEFKSSKYLDMLLELCPEIPSSEAGALSAARLPRLRRVVCIERALPGVLGLQDIIDRGRTLPDTELRRVAAELGPDDDINIQYTSGTTGFPKGVVLSHFNILNNGYHVANVMRLTSEDRLCIPVPFYHCFGMVLSNLACVTSGATMVVPGPIFDPVAVLQAVQQERCTALHGVPTMFIAELNHPALTSFDLSKLRTGIMAGAPCPIETMREVIDKMNMADVTIAYGMTEASPVTTMTRLDDPVERRVSTVGRVMPWQQLKVIDPATGRTLPRGQQGEICFRGYNIMSRYNNNPEATAETIDAAQWLHSGDLGVMDEQGYVKITGRIKEMVIRGGENLYPREIEEFLRTSPKIMDVYVIGVPDVKYGEELMAWVLPRDGAECDEAELRAFCRGRITHHKVPRYWKFVGASEDFPMTVTGKIQKFKMREYAIEELGLQAAAKVETA